MCLNPQMIVVKRKVDGVIVRDGMQEVACGKCVQCLQRRADEWAYRCMLEASLHDECCFLTLTYNNEMIPPNGNLCRRDLQLFNKRLRAYLAPKKIRLFYCGEYGRRGSRPHYHEIIFGWKPDDVYFFKNDGKLPLYRSPTIERLWSVECIDYSGPIGYCSVGELTFESARYCAKYLQKLSPLPPDKVPPFTGMSNRPGIGYGKISPQILLDGVIYVNGRMISIPRYFRKVLAEGHDLEDWNQQRIELAKERNFYLNRDRSKIRKKFQKSLEKLLTKE